MSEDLRERCANCGNPLAGVYCSACGQKDLPTRLSFWTLMGQWLRETFEADGRLGRTVGPLFLRPGFLVVEYLRGRRAHYTSPVRLYVFALLVSTLAVEWVAAPELTFQFGGPEEIAGSGELIEELQGYWKARFNALRALGEEEASRRVSKELYDSLPTVLTLMLPLAALLLELFYRKRYYVEHLVFTIQLHTLALLLFAVAAVVQNPWAVLLAAGISLVHFIGALRAVYGEPWPRLLTKALFVVALYSVLLALVMVGSVLLAVAKT